jgi:predicted phage terminase large subunit-like protein
MVAEHHEQGGQNWTPIPRIRGSKLHAETQFTLSLPLIAGKEPPYRDSKTNTVYMRRQPGDVLHPDRFSADDIARLKREIAPHAFEAQYQQSPRLGGSGMCSIDRLHFYSQRPKFESVVHSWDIGATVNGNATVCTKWGLAKSAEGQDTLFLTDVVRLKLEIPDVRAAIRSQDKLDKPDLIILDHRGVGLGIEQDLVKDGWRHVKSVSKGLTNETKIDRFGRALAEFYDGLVRFPNSAAFLDQLISDLVTFPDLKEDDLIDSITQVAAFRERVCSLARTGLRP